MTRIDTIEALDALYGQPGEAARVKVTSRLIPAYRAWIERSRFCVISTVGPEGTDGSPRGDAGPVARVQDDRTLLIPDWRGNNRIDTLRNIVRDGRISLMFLVAGSTTAMRVNGTATVSADPALLDRFEQNGKHPRSVIVVHIAEVYSQCARAVMRAGLWTDGDQSEGLPSVGDMLREATSGAFDGASYDKDWPARAKTSMW
ncbi:pyridoxamine 5'-phosphate oxidase family protein [Sinisalibacter aestuarii]|uniref:Pyridoxamine 5'-phosphate oxidase-related FMN-binding protein n=1 Tax=Sinisalibacter aestuarii TaxID=2949426 RepID=A0ABQ5LQ94_9RHOB|nr:pyridoxamine 5'-phosphate oxidase family protein [Sinisalibacter aestuarii]GKY86227.1 pyridoxamine 5'-phosphate oxidase-related FMN-binding protein [Sinisalibacter aestuarii]